MSDDDGIRPFEYYSRLLKIRTYVRAHLDEDISLLDLADHLHVSAEHLSRDFRQKSGVRFRDWLTNQRISRAKKLLRNGDANITCIAHDVGYSSLSAFSRAFRRSVGQSPRQYRRRRD